MAAEDPRAHLWQNICRLMGQEAPSIDAVQERTGIGRGTVQRIRDGDAAVRISSLLAVAEAFKIEVWQLLLPNLNPEAVPADLMAVTADERELLQGWREKRATRPRTLADLPRLPAGVVLIPERRRPGGKEITNYPNDRRARTTPAVEDRNDDIITKAGPRKTPSRIR